MAPPSALVVAPAPAATSTTSCPVLRPPAGPTATPRPSRNRQVLPPTPIAYADHDGTTIPLEVSVHAVGRRFARELVGVFPDMPSYTESLHDDSEPTLLVIPVVQPTEHDLVEFGRDVDAERDVMLERFVRFAHALAERVEKEGGRWADMTDPASGYPIRTRPGPRLYPDVPGIQTLLRYDAMNVGCCSVLLHPRWGSHMYPATFFAVAPARVVLDALAEIGLQRRGAVGCDSE
ncbi:hypothetical protein GGF32_003836 [Allomyces javanicus]|nr:hypothetical protein GGF32_003836 [Allomyces javanicus]